MIQLLDEDTGAALGTITEEQFQFLTDQLQEESLEDVDYYISQATIDLFEQRGADPQLLELLRRALGDREGTEIQWVRS